MLFWVLAQVLLSVQTVTDDSELRARLYVALQEFALEHPGAVDTFEGISEFWIPGADPYVLAQVIEALVLEGLLVKMRIAGRAHYRITQNLIAHARNFNGTENEPN